MLKTMELFLWGDCFNNRFKIAARHILWFIFNKNKKLIILLSIFNKIVYLHWFINYT